MGIAGIIAEYNPFHRGHAYMVSQVRRELKPSAVVAVMSGSFVQRGEPAMWDKWTRAGFALQNGVDLVLELPTVFACNSAGEFAYGGVKLLSSLGVVSDIAFGSEGGDVDELIRTADFLYEEGPSFSDRLKEALQEGLSYPKAYAIAYSEASASEGEHGGSSAISKRSSPNDILAVEYIKQCKAQGSPLKPFAVKRIGSGHDSPESVGSFLSASAIRQQLRSGSMSDAVKASLPQGVAEAPAMLQCYNHNDEQVFFALARYCLRTRSGRELFDCLSVAEGLENSLKAAIVKAESADELIRAAKSKRYTYARLSRILIQAMLGIDKEGYAFIKDRGLMYARVLGFTDAGAAVLRDMSKNASVPVITNLNKNISESDDAYALLAYDIKASDIYSIIRGKSIYQWSDFVKTPVIEKFNSNFAR